MFGAVPTSTVLATCCARPYDGFDRRDQIVETTDANGSVEALDDATTGAAQAKYAYDPYGNALDTTTGTDLSDVNGGLSDEAKDQPMRFQGFYANSGVRSYDMRARQYLPQAGRFLTQDRFESSSGDFNLVADPLTQNRYAFAGGNPIGNVEFDGHKACTSTCKPGETAVQGTGRRASRASSDRRTDRTRLRVFRARRRGGACRKQTPPSLHSDRTSEPRPVSGLRT